MMTIWLVAKKISKMTNEKRSYNKDFLGIDMLVTVACNNSMRGERDHADDAREKMVGEI